MKRMKKEGTTDKHTVLEVVRLKQMVLERPVKYQTKLTNAALGKEIAIAEIGDEAQEVVLLMVLNNQNEINAIHRIALGGVSNSFVSPREVFASALLNNGARILLAHNHPGGSLQPSPADIAITKKLQYLGFIMGIDLVDHFIVSGTEGISLRQLGVFEGAKALKEEELAAFK